MSSWSKRKLSGSFSRPQKVSYASFLLRERRKVRKPRETAGFSFFSFSFLWQKYRSLLLGIGAALIFFVVLGGIFFFSNFFDIRDIALTRKDLRVNIPGMSQLLSGLQGRNIFSVSEEEIEAALKKRFPELESISMRKDWPNRLEVTVATFPVVARWEMRVIAPEADDTLPTTRRREPAPQQKIFFLNSQGQISPIGAELTAPAFLISEEVSEIRAGLETGMRLIDGARLQEVLSARDLLASKIPLPIRSAQFFRDAQEVRFVSVEGPQFWLDFQTPLAEQIAKIDVAQAEAQLLEKNLTYVDLRIPGRVIYHES